jgi:hypothetical protein
MTFEFNQKPGVVVTLFFRYAGITGFVESDPGLDQRGLGYGVGRDAFGCAPAQDGFGGNKHECDPDEQKSDKMLAGECLMINKEPEDEANAGREILKKTDRDQAQMSRGMAKPNQRNSGDDPSRRKDGGE